LLSHVEPPWPPHPAWAPPPPMLAATAVPVLAANPPPFADTTPEIVIDPDTSRTVDEAPLVLSTPTTVIAPEAVTVHVPSTVSAPPAATFSESML
jgi:hypothetical protein